jgi:hypothetical protein
MTKEQAKRILAQQREGIAQSYANVCQALVLTGDGVNVK